MLKESSTFRNIFKVASAKIFSLSATLITSIIVARATNPELFGYFSVSISIIVIYEAMIGAPFDNAVVRFNSLHAANKERVSRIQGLVFKLKILLCFLTFGLVYIYYSEISKILFSESAPRYILAATIFGGLSILVLRSSASHMQIHNLFSDYSKLDTYQGILRFILALGLYLLKTKSILIYLIAYGSSSLFVFFVYLGKKKQDFIRARLPSKADCSKILSYFGLTSLIIILGTITGRADLPILSTKVTPTEVGNYSVAVQFALLGTLLASYASIVFQPNVVSIARNNKLLSMINKNLLYGFALGILAIPVSIYLIPVIIPLMFGDAYSGSIPIFRILVIGIIADIMIMPILMPFSMQVLPTTILMGEFVITILFITIVFYLPNITPEIMAWIVSLIRILKLIFYLTAVRLYLSCHNKTSNDLHKTITD